MSNTMAATATSPRRIHWVNLFWLSLVHVVSIGAIFHFSWGGFAVFLLGVFVLAPLGVNLGYHRLLTHKGMKVPKWLEYTFATIGAAIGGGPPLHWVAEHRLHHRFSDTPQDPHDASQGFWHSHITHLFYHKDFEDIEEQWLKYVPDYANDRYYRFLNKYWLWFAVPTVLPLYYFGGWSWVFWGGFVRVLFMLHMTWFVNSASHMWGYRNYEIEDKAVNCWWVGLIAAGEGWHNNHHAMPMSARHGHKWWELDLTWGYIRLLEILGLARDIKRPRLNEAAVTEGASA